MVRSRGLNHLKGNVKMAQPTNCGRTIVDEKTQSGDKRKS